jgi:hypothetical protein
VFWYCYKRGREVRLEKERLLTEEEVAKLEKEYKTSSGSDIQTTTAPDGAPIEDVEAGVREAQEASRTVVENDGAPKLTCPSALNTIVQLTEQTGV